MDKLGITDASFLHFERDGAPMNIGSAQRFATPYQRFDAACFYQRLKRYIADRVSGVPFMTQRLKRTPFDLDQPVWVTDTEFDIDRHVFRNRLPPPGNDHQLAELIARLHEAPLDRRRPLWEVHFIDGFDDDTFVIYNKYHHAAVDGISGQQVMKVLYSTTSEGNPPPVAKPAVDDVSDTSLLLDAMLNLTLQPFQQLSRAGERIRAISRVSALLQQSTDAGAIGTAPDSPFNRRVSAYRTFAATALPLDEMRALGRQRSATANDVLLAVCAGGLRSFLLRRRALPEAPLLAGIPVSLRSASDRSYANRVSMLRASLATHVEDPVDRLDAIASSTRAGKALLTEARSLMPEDLHVPGLSWLVQSAMRFSEVMQPRTLPTPAVNVLISNVPGPRKTQYLMGAEMLTHHPVSIAADGLALNITVQSYRGRLDLGITACLEAVPDVKALRDDLDASWRALRAACEPEALKAVA